MVSFLNNQKKKVLKKITISEIAKIAGVSRTTVSRVLSGGSFVNRNTKYKVLEIIEKNEYNPSIIAQSLRTHKTRTIGLVLADIENMFYSRVAKGVIDAAEIKKYNVILCNSNNDIDSEERDIRTLMARGVDGLIITTVALKMKTIENLIEREFPFILIDCKIDSPGVNYVVNDDYYGAKLATRYLIELGHRKIFFLGDKKLLSLKERFRGFKDTLKENNIEVNNTFMMDKFINIFDIYTIEKIFGHLINQEEKITAIFAGNDYLAIKLIKVINDYGLRVPEDISIIGYDNIEISSMINVPLTTIRQPNICLAN
jgi:LacI family transcriptional regulator